MQTLFTTLSGSANLLDPEGLAANRAGQISDAQSQRLNMAIAWNQGCVTLIFLPISILLGIMALGSLFAGDFGPNMLIPAVCFGGVALLFLVISVAGAWNMFSGWRQVSRDRQNNAIRQAQGRVSFDKNGYSFDADGRRLKLPSPEHTGGLLPGGVYRVFYLEESGVVLSAEEVFPPSPAQTRAALTEILAQANGFTLDDLAANRNGEVTPAQRMKPLSQVIGGAIFGLMALAFGGLFFFQVFPSADAGEALPAMVISALVLGIFALVGGWMFLNGLLDIAVSSLEQAQGAGRKEKRTSGGKSRSTRYYYVIDGKSFQVARRAYTALLEGMDYRIYYLPRTKKLVSIEPVDVTTEAAQYNF